MNAKQIAEVLARVPRADERDEGTLAFPVDGEVTLYFGRHGERVSVSKVRRVTVEGDWVEVHGQRECAFFPVEEFLGVKAAEPEKSDEPKRAGFVR